MVDLINKRVNEAQAEIQKRAVRLEKLVKESKGKKTADGFQEGVNILREMIKSQSEIIDKAVFEAPETSLEQIRNLHLTTGLMNETPKHYLKPTTDAMDMMLKQLESMVR